MIIAILILIAIFLLGMGCGAAIWFAFKHRETVKSKEPTIRSKEPTKGTTTRDTLPFRWRYILLPVAILFLSIILAAYFHHLLPAEVAYHFKLDGSPDKWLSREMTIAWALTPQILLTLVAGAITWGTTKLGIPLRQAESTPIKPEGILLLMGNMIALPQIILCFAILDILSYNSYQIHIMPIWVFALIIMGLGGITLGIFFIRIIQQAWGASR